MATCVCPFPRTDCPRCVFACPACVEMRSPAPMLAYVASPSPAPTLDAAPHTHPRPGDVYRNDGIGEVTLAGRNKRNDGWTTSNPGVELMDSGFASGHHKLVRVGVAPDVVPLSMAEQQRRSFAYGNTAIENPRITRAIIDRAAEAIAKEDAAEQARKSAALKQLEATIMARTSEDEQTIAALRADLATERARSAGLTLALEVARGALREIRDRGTMEDEDTRIASLALTAIGAVTKENT